MFELEEDDLLGEGLSEGKRWKNTREPYEKIHVEANGGIDIHGEWQFEGSYKVRVLPHVVDNFYSYEGSIYKGYKRKGRWRVDLRVCGGESNRISLNVLSKTSPSIKQAKKMILQAIIDFEKTSRYKEEMAPKIYHEDNRVPIIKEINGELFWVATTWGEAYSTIQGRIGYSFIQCPLGNGLFYYRKRKWEMEYPRKEDGTKDYDAEPEKVYHAPVYGSIKASSWSSCSGNTHEKKEKINEAVFELKNEQELKRQYIRYLSLKGRI